MRPYLAPPPADPIQIDPGIDYFYVIPANGATSYSFIPAAGFAITLFGGGVLQIKFIGTPPSTPTPYPITITAKNSEGSVSQTINFTPATTQVSSALTRFIATADGTSNLKFPNSQLMLRVNDAFADTLGDILYVVSVDAAAGTFQYATSQGGSPITPLSVGDLTLFAATSADGYTALWVGDTSSLVVNQPVRISHFTNVGVDLESALQARVYIKTIIDPWHITVSATVGGAAIVASTTAYTRTRIIVADASGARTVPNITTFAASTFAQGAAVTIPIITDIPADSYQALNLPAGLTLSGSTITGTAPAVDRWFAVTLVARLGAQSFYRYWLVTVGAGGIVGFGFSPGGPSSSGGILYDGDYTIAQPNGQPIPIIPFKTDPKPYIYRQSYWQFFANYEPLALGTVGPFGGYHVGEVTGSFKDIGGGIIEFAREFSFVPDPRGNEYESFTYSFQIVHQGGAGASITEIPTTVNSRLQFDYFKTDNPQSIVLDKAPRAIQDGQQLYFLHGWGNLIAGEEALAEDTTLKPWNGNIYERRQRFIVILAFGQAV